MTTNPNVLAVALLRSIRFDYECPRVQNAIDKMAAEFGGRDRLVGWLKQETKFPSAPESTMSAINILMSAWQPYIEAATGRPVEHFMRITGSRI